MSDCLFCKIIKGEIPSEKVYEDENTLAFRDIKPQAPTHVLVIPRDHYASVHEVPSERMGLISEVFAAVKQVVAREKLTVEGYRLVINFGSNAGQLVDHIHVHVLGGRAMQWPPG